MAITKEVVYDKVEIVSEFKHIHCREATVIKEDGVEISRSFHRHVLSAGEDVSGEPQEVQDICNLVWTDEVKQAWADKKAEADARTFPQNTMIINWLLAVVLVAGIAVIAVSFAEWLKDG